MFSKLLYGLHTARFTTAQFRRLDGFQARRLRSILRIPPAYISRISNAVVRDRAECQPLSVHLQMRQLVLLGSLARRPDDDPVRRCVLLPGGLRTVQYPLRRGRPVKTWGPDVAALALQVAGSADVLSIFLQPATPPSMWTAAVRHYFGIFFSVRCLSAGW